MANINNGPINSSRLVSRQSATNNKCWKLAFAIHLRNLILKSHPEDLADVSQGRIHTRVLFEVRKRHINLPTSDTCRSREGERGALHSGDFKAPEPCRKTPAQRSWSKL